MITKTYWVTPANGIEKYCICENTGKVIAILRLKPINRKDGDASWFESDTYKNAKSF